jgi:hypothetical protein
MTNEHTRKVEEAMNSTNAARCITRKIGRLGHWFLQDHECLFWEKGNPTKMKTKTKTRGDPHRRRAEVVGR